MKKIILLTCLLALTSWSMAKDNVNSSSPDIIKGKAGTDMILVAPNPLATPTITGPGSVCENSTDNLYTTEPGMSNYSWIVSGGGTITAGGSSTDNSVTVTWNTSGPQTVSVSYTGGTGTASYNVIVHDFPVPSISGSNSVCVGSTGNIYTTEAGMSNYMWTISTGGTITSGGTSTSSFIAVTWNTVGAKSVRLVYTNSFGCIADEETVFNVTVHSLPTPSISGIAEVCRGTSGVIYTTEPGKTNYTWNVSLGGVITSGGTSNSSTATITWNTAGSQQVLVNYSDVYGCRSVSDVSYNVTVNQLPVPTVIGDDNVCLNSAGNVYTTEAGMNNYEWLVPTGGTITSGGTSSDNSVILTWNTAGNHEVEINYTDENGCTAMDETTLDVIVNALPVATLNGNSSVCFNSSGNVYTTEPGMSNYSWVISDGGTITSGGTSTNNTVTITWDVAEDQDMDVIYFDGNGCVPLDSAELDVVVHELPTPVITGLNEVCAGTEDIVYTTEAGKTNYEWVISAGGTITAGGTSTDNTVTVLWETGGPQEVSVNYNDVFGCTAAVETSFDVLVNPEPIPVITGTNSLCVGTMGVVYTTEPGMSNYIWTVSAGGVVTAGGTDIDNTITVNWTMAGLQEVGVIYTNANGCTEDEETDYFITVHSLPVPVITGDDETCINSTENVYSASTGMSNYIWTVSSGGTITSGGSATDNSINVTWDVAGPQTVSLLYTNGNGCVASTATIYDVNVNLLPVPTIVGNDNACVNSEDNVFTTEPGMTNYVWTVSSDGTITDGGSLTDNTITITWDAVGMQEVSITYIDEEGCSPVDETSFDVTVNSLPIPTIIGDTTVCALTEGVIYTTEPGKEAYTWTISGGGVITDGGTSTDNTITVTWISDGVQEVDINYTDVNGCSAQDETDLEVLVFPLQVPVITGEDVVCTGTTYTYSTQMNNTSYTWEISTGGIITDGGEPDDSTITILWYLNGERDVYVNFVDSNGCTATESSEYTVQAHALPEPAITGSTSVCLNSTGNVYTTEPGMNNYEWVLSAGGTISAGGTSMDNTVTIDWNTQGSQEVSVNYTTSFGCNNDEATDFPVFVNNFALPVPTVSGNNNVCIGSAGVLYTTESSMSNYLWNIPAGGTIISGGALTDNTVTVLWNATGAQTVSINYENANGCTANNAVEYMVNVNALPVISITGADTVCFGSTEVLYSTDSSMSNYLWNISAGGTIISGGTLTDSTVTVLWNANGAQNVSVNCENESGCTATQPIVYTVNIINLPVPSIAGANSVCTGNDEHVYTTENNMSNYLWSIPAGGTITSGGTSTDNTVNVIWNMTGAQTVSVNYENSNGCFATNPTIYTVNVNDLPIPSITGATVISIGSTEVYSTETGMSDYKWDISAGGSITAGGTLNDNTVTVLWNTIGMETVSVNYTNTNGCTANNAVVLDASIITGLGELTANSDFDIYPAPNDGQFTVRINTDSEKYFDIVIINAVGSVVYEENKVFVKGNLEHKIKITQVPAGIYNVMLKSNNDQIIRKMIVTN